MGIVTPTAVQAAAIPIALEERDVVAIAQTGTGKTLGFVLPGLTLLARGSVARNQMLVLLPTRELCLQVQEVFETVGKALKIRSVAVYGGVSLERQASEIRRGVPVIVATPGRLLDHMSRGNLRFKDLEILVLDEADRMLDIGFLPDLQRILSYLPKQRQTLLFSATFSPEIKKLASSYLQDPVLVEVARPNATASTVEQRFYKVEDDDKRAVIRQILRDRGIGQCIVFVNSKIGAGRLARSFERDGLKTAALHGDKSQDERLKSLDAFKKGEVEVLVATDVAARGIDIAALPAVFNFDIPFNAEDYVHRIGRTGRAGASGLAVSLVTGSDARLMADIEKLIKKKPEVEAFVLEGRRERFGDRSGERPSYRRREEQDDRPDLAAAAPREARDSRSARPAPRRAPADPFFDQPYEPSVSAEPAAWEAKEARESAAAAGGNGGGLSRFIKPKRKVATLLGGSGTVRR
ncbi:MAG: DEAD/DEAH box helicase [Proteobacteria bacterium]|nr:DEAD/DEAH box helicase [Pseudomonadota bacterium]